MTPSSPEPNRSEFARLAELEAALQASEARSHFLLALSTTVRPLAEPAEIAATVTRLVGEHFRVDRTGFGETEPDQEHVLVTSEWRQPEMPSLLGRIRMRDYGEVGDRLRTGEPFILSDAATDPRTQKERAAYASIHLRGALVVPLLRSARLVALLWLNTRAPRQWSPEEINFMGVAVNILWEAVERARATQVSKENEERFRALADNIAQLAWMADDKGWIFWYNRRWFDYTGTTLEQMQGWGWAQVHHPEHLRRVTDKWSHHLAAGEGWEDTFPLRGADGQYRWFLSRAFPIRDAAGEVLRWFGTNTDVTEQRASAEALALAKEEAEAANRAKDDFLAALSHELRTPLTPVLMTAAALREEERLPLDVREALGMMQRNIELEARLIDDLLDLTRIARGKVTMREVDCEAHALLGIALEIVREEAAGKQLTVETELAARQTRLRGDAVRLQQVFWNLLKNAVKFTPSGGRVLVRSQNAEGRILIEISDTGVGIDPAALERIFQPFDQAGRVNDHRFGGLGLGLSISKAIVDLHGGTITAASEGLDRGARFQVRLPASEGAPVQTESEPADLVLDRPLRLLLVEDHEPTLLVLTRLLTRAGHAVSSASRVAAARELASRQTFDLMISDIGLPDGTGIELMKELRHAHGLRGVALSGYGMEEDLRRSREAGFEVHLVKPVDFGQLRRTLAQFTASC